MRQFRRVDAETFAVMRQLRERLFKNIIGDDEVPPHIVYESVEERVANSPIGLFEEIRTDRGEDLYPSSTSNLSPTSLLKDLWVQHGSRWLKIHYSVLHECYPPPPLDAPQRERVWRAIETAWDLWGHEIGDRISYCVPLDEDQRLDDKIMYPTREEERWYHLWGTLMYKIRRDVRILDALRLQELINLLHPDENRLAITLSLDSSLLVTFGRGKADVRPLRCRR